MKFDSFRPASLATDLPIAFVRFGLFNKSTVVISKSGDAAIGFSPVARRCSDACGRRPVHATFIVGRHVA